MMRRKALQAVAFVFCIIGQGSLAKKDKKNQANGQIKYVLPQQSSSSGGGQGKPSKKGKNYKNPLTQNPPTTSEPVLLWSDEFVGNHQNPDLSYWSIDPSSQVFTADHYLFMVASSDSQQTTASHLTTTDRVEFTYGTLEARIKVPDMLNNGIWANFWTLRSSDLTAGPLGEVTIMEMGSNTSITPAYLINHRVKSSVHYDTIDGHYETYAKTRDGSVNLSEDFHIYRLEWTPETMTTYVDDEWIWEIDINPEICPSCNELHLPHHIHLNLAVGGRFGCSGDCGRFARGEMLVDYVRLYDNGYTRSSIDGNKNGSWNTYPTNNKKGGSSPSYTTSSTTKYSKGNKRRRRLAASSRSRTGARLQRNIRGAAR